MNLVAVTGFEPVTPRVWTVCSDHLSYTAKYWCPQADLNCWPLRYQRSALPAELCGQNGGSARIRTLEGWANGFTARPIWPLWYTSIISLVSCVIFKLPAQICLFGNFEQMNNRWGKDCCQQLPRPRVYPCFSVILPCSYTNVLPVQFMFLSNCSQKRTTLRTAQGCFFVRISLKNNAQFFDRRFLG